MGIVYIFRIGYVKGVHEYTPDDTSSWAGRKFGGIGRGCDIHVDKGVVV